jgi:hypothetical protein
MQIQLFRVTRVKRRSEGRVFEEDNQTIAGSTSHSDDDGNTYELDEDGFFDVPYEHGAALLTRVVHDAPHRCKYVYLTPAELDESVLAELRSRAEKMQSEPAAAKEAPKVQAEPPQKESRAEKNAREKAEKEAAQASADAEAEQVDEQAKFLEGWQATGVDEAEWGRDDDGRLLAPPGA